MTLRNLHLPEAYRNGILFRRILSTTSTNLDHQKCPLDEIYKSRSSGVGDRGGWGGMEIRMWGGVKWGWGVGHMGVALLLRARILHKGSEDIFANTTLRTLRHCVSTSCRFKNTTSIWTYKWLNIYEWVIEHLASPRRVGLTTLPPRHFLKCDRNWRCQ